MQNRETLAPVEKGDQRTVDIEDIGDQDDGIARTGPGYVLIIPDTEQGERVTVEVTDVSENPIRSNRGWTPILVHEGDT
nr:TRAM domain-containing protein [Halogranum salarium]